jgi:hemolysin III
MDSEHTQGFRPRTLGEEIASSLSHGVGLLAGLVATPFLVAAANRRGDTQTVVCVGVFLVTLILLYLSSTLYHAIPGGREKRFFEVLDNCAVFLLIGGTYTPLTLGFLRGTWGWSLFALVWAMAGAGVCLATVCKLRYPVASVFLCLAMGWLSLFALREIAVRMPRTGVLLIVAGGVAYTTGVAFWAAHRMRYSHLVWHLFVLMGTTCHFIVIYLYAT